MSNVLHSGRHTTETGLLCRVNLTTEVGNDFSVRERLHNSGMLLDFVVGCATGLKT